jgi:hypothetical protein
MACLRPNDGRENRNNPGAGWASVMEEKQAWRLKGALNGNVQFGEAA